jgi:predicted Zn-dependent peptidase
MLFRGTQRRTGLALAQAVESLGGHVDASTGKEFTTVFARIHPGNLRRALNLLSEIISSPSLEPQFVELEKKVVLEEIRSYEDDPEDGVHDLMASSLWPGHPMGRPILGYEETVQSFTTEQLRKYHERSYRGCNVVIAAAGDVDPHRFVDLTSQAFRLPRGGRQGRPGSLPRFRPQALHKERPLQRTHIVMATRGPSYRERQRYPIYLLNLILGAGSSSRLFRRIREREGLAYAVHSFVDSYEDTGVFGVYLCVDPKNLGRTFRLLSEEMGRLRREGIKRWELESAKAQMVLMHSVSQESVSERVGRLALKEFLYRRQPPDGRVVEMVRSVTADEILRATPRILDPGKYCLVTMGPENGNLQAVSGLEF